MTQTDAELRTAAEFVCVTFHPSGLRKNYLRDIRVKYKAEAIVYVLQALSFGLTTIFLGLLTNYLYDKVKQPGSKAVDVEELLHRHEEKIAELELMIQSSENQRASSALKFHKEALQKIKSSDPSIEAMVEDALKQLERYGQDKMKKHVEKYHD